MAPWPPWPPPSLGFRVDLRGAIGFRGCFVDGDFE